MTGPSETAAPESQTPPGGEEPIGKKGGGKSELGTRLVFGPLMLIAIAGIFLFDSEIARGLRFGVDVDPANGIPDRDLGGWPTALVLGLLGFAGTWEYVAMMRKAGFAVAPRLLPGTALALFAVPFFFGWDQLDRELYPMILATFVLLFPIAIDSLTRRGMTQGLELMGGSLLGFIWIAWPMYLAQGTAIRHLPSVLFVVLVCKSGDIGAYFVGSFFGKRKLIPHISSGKTIEGGFGSLGASILVGVLLAPHLLVSLSPAVDVEPREIPERTLAWDTLSVLEVVGISILLNLTTQTGDLIESLLKRRCGVKNSSDMLPAHGGVLDLIDSLLFSFPAYFWILIVVTGE